MRLCLKYLVRLSKWRVELGFWEVVYFLVPEETVYSFPISISIGFGIAEIWPCTRAWRKEFGLKLSFYKPHSIPDIEFAVIPSLFLPYLKLLITDLSKLTSSILIEIVTVPAVLVDQFYLCTHQSTGLVF